MSQRDMEHLHDEEEPTPDFAAGEAAQVFISIFCMIGLAAFGAAALMSVFDRFYQ